MRIGCKGLFWIATFGFLVGFVMLFESVLLPFLVGLIIAYLLDPICDRLESVGCSRTGATLIVGIGFFMVCVITCALIIPVLYKQIIQFLVQLPDLISRIQHKLLPLFEGIIDTRANNEAGLYAFLNKSMLGTAQFLGQVGARLVSGISIVANIIGILIVTPVVIFYFLRDWDKLIATVDDWLPREHLDTIREQFALIDETLAGFLRGQFSVCLILGVFYAIGLTVVGLPFGAALGFVTGLISFVPYVGMLAGFLVGIGLAIANFDNSLMVVMVAAVFLVGQLIEGSFLTPKFVGDRVNLHAIWILFALMGGSTLFGFVGMLLAIPVAAIVGVMMRFALGRYLESPFYREGEISKQTSDRERDLR